MNTMAGISFQLAVKKNHTTAPDAIHSAATTNRNAGLDGRRPTWGVGSASSGVDGLELDLGGVYRPPFFLSGTPLTVPQRDD